MDEYQAEALADGKVLDAIHGTLIDCANWADGYIHSHDDCNEINLRSIRKEEQGDGEKD